MTVLGIFGIVVALVLFMLLVYKGWSSYWVAPICVVIVAATNLMNPVEAFTKFFIPGVLDMALNIFTVVFMGAILGRVFTASGAAASIATTLTGKFITGVSQEKQVNQTIFCLLVISTLLTLGGIDAYVMYFTLFPVCLTISKRINIPRRFIPGMLCLNTAFIAAPGVPNFYNIMANVAFTGVGITLPNAFGLTGYVGCLVVAIGGYFILTRMINKAMANGEVFEYGDLQVKDEDEKRKLPNFWVSVLPLLIVFVFYTVLGLNISVALSSGIIATLIFMHRYIPTDGRALKLTGLKQFFGPNRVINTLNDGVGMYPNAILQLATPSGLATVITATAVFGAVVAWLGGISIHPFLLAVLVVAVVAAITSSPLVAIMVTGPLIAGVVLQTGISIEYGHLARIVALGASTFETLPANGAILLAMGLAKTTHKEAYKPMFYMTCIFTTLATVVVAVLYLIFPALP
jgi:H+/gluconate symporter-like permease